MKKTLCAILVIFILNINCVYAENWVTINAENGKSADLDLDSINLTVDTVEYDIRTENNGYTYINKLSTELYKEGMPTAVVSRSKNKDGVVIHNEIIDNRNYKISKSGTLQTEIFDVLSKKLEKRSFAKGTGTWKKYLKKQRKTIYQNWNTQKVYNWDYADHISPTASDDALFIIDKEGNIIEKKYNTGALGSINLSSLDELPAAYTADTFHLNVKMKRFKYAGAKLYAKKNAVKQNSPISSEITIAKNYRPPIIGHIELGLLSIVYMFQNLESWIEDSSSDDLLLLLLSIPIGLAGIISSIAMEIVFGMLFILFGGDMDDL